MWLSLGSKEPMSQTFPRMSDTVLYFQLKTKNLFWKTNIYFSLSYIENRWKLFNSHKCERERGIAEREREGN